MTEDFISREDLPLFTSGSRFSLASMFLKEGMRETLATFDLFIRDLPPSRNFFVFGGLEHVVNYLAHLSFTDAQLAWLQKQFRFSDDEMGYFKHFRFTGDLWAMPEGTVFFPNEPIIRITAPLIEAQIIEMFLINAVYLQTALASKLARFVSAANDKQTALGFNRSYGTDAAMKATKWCKIFGAKTSLAAFDFKNGDAPPFSVGTFHYLIMAYDSELAAFKKYLQHTDGKGYVLIDTYDSIRGITNYIQAAKEFEKKGERVTGIQLDSGDLYDLSVQARKMLDEAGLRHAKIFAMSNLDEWKVDALEKKQAPIDVYAGVTELLTPSDSPTLELVYKLSEFHKDGKSILKMKTSSQKVSLPGKKQVFRVSKNGKYVEDIIAIETETSEGEPMLVPIIKDGELMYKNPTLTEMGVFYKKEKKKFDPNLFDVNKKVAYPVQISKNLQKLAKETREHIERIHHFDAEF